MDVFEIINQKNNISQFIEAVDSEQAVERYMSAHGPKFHDYYDKPEVTFFSLDSIESVPERDDEFENAKKQFEHDFKEMMDNLNVIKVYNKDEETIELNQ